jgi:flagellar protein FliS
VNQRQRASLASRYNTDGMTGSSPQKLLIAMFDRLQRDLGTAVAAIGRHDVEASHRALLNAQDLVYELNMALDLDAWPAAHELRSIYQHLMDLMIEANLKKDPKLIVACQAIVDPLADSWRAAYQTLQAQKLDAALSAVAPGSP